MCRQRTGHLGRMPSTWWHSETPRSRTWWCVQSAREEPPHQECLTELHQAGARLDREGFWWRPSWQALRDGARPEEHVVGEPGEWQHGWQYWASSISDSYFRKTSLLPVRPAASRAHLRSHSGPNAGAALAYAPTAPENTIPPHLFRVIVLERLQLPLPIAEATCAGCRAPLDPLGRHRASCTRTGRVKTRAGPVECVMARICRETGARVRFNALLRDMNSGMRYRQKAHRSLGPGLAVFRRSSTRGGCHVSRRPVQ